MDELGLLMGIFIIILMNSLRTFAISLLIFASIKAEHYIVIVIFNIPIKYPPSFHIVPHPLFCFKCWNKYNYIHRYLFLAWLFREENIEKMEKLNHNFKKKWYAWFLDEFFLRRSERTWTEQRRFTLKTLKEFGFGKSGMEEIISEELNEFIPFLLEESKNNGSILVMNLFNISILNIIWRIVNGSRYDYK